LLRAWSNEKIVLSLAGAVALALVIAGRGKVSVDELLAITCFKDERVNEVLPTTICEALRTLLREC